MLMLGLEKGSMIENSDNGTDLNGVDGDDNGDGDDGDGDDDGVGDDGDGALARCVEEKANSSVG